MSEDVNASWLQMKVASQAKALDALNRKVMSQRFYLRVLNELGKDISKEEYLAAKATLNEQSQKRLEDYASIGA